MGMVANMVMVMVMPCFFEFCRTSGVFKRILVRKISNELVYLFLETER